MKLTKRNRANLRKLAKYLYALDGELNRSFNMEYYARDCEGMSVKPCDTPECGTVVCALGYAAVVFPRIAKKHNHWWEFCFDVFGFCFDVFGLDGLEGGYIWNFLFSYRWTYIDNTITGAADRITYFLKHGIPDDCWNPEVYRSAS